MGTKAPSTDLLLALRSSLLQSSRCPHLHHRPRIRLPTRSFHSTPCVAQKRKPKHKNMTKDEMDRLIAQRAKDYTPYSAEERKALAGKYNPEQMAAIEAGERAITAEELAKQGKIRRDFLMPRYLDDFSRIERTIDKKIEKLRGEGQDYENATTATEMPTAGELALAMTPETLFDQPVRNANADTSTWGAWDVSQTKDGKAKFDFKWNQEQLDKLTEEDFFKTQEGKELLTPVIEQRRADEAVASQLRAAGASEEEILRMEQIVELGSLEHQKEHGVQAAVVDLPDETASAEEQEDGNEDEDDIDEDIDNPELEPEEPLAPLLSREEYLTRLAEVDTVKHAARAQAPDLSYRSHPRYIGIRNRLAVTMRPGMSDWQFGTSESDRQISEYMTGNLPDVAPEIPPFVDPTIVHAQTAPETDGEEKDPNGGLEDEALEAYQRVAKSMGVTVKDLLAYKVKTLVSHRVVNQTRLGKISSIYNLCVAGNGRGLVGLGEGKATEGDESVRMARLNAIKNMVPILRYENRTIYGDIDGKVGASVVQLGTRRPGFGVRTNAIIFEIARCAGLFDLSARTPRSRNPMNMAKATWEALRKQRHPEDIALGRQRKLVDVRKVYYSGGV